jgi:methionyl-tRNA formyltransferase
MLKRIILFVDHEIGFRILKRVLEIQDCEHLSVVAVVTSMENGKEWWPGVFELCQQYEINFHRFSDNFIDSLAYQDIDWYFLISWKHIISEALIDHPKNGVINLHYSLLPEYRGVYPVNWAIIEGRETTGITYHLIGDGIDDGEIICQQEEVIFFSDNARTLQLRLDTAAFKLFDTLLLLLKKNNIPKLNSRQSKKNHGSYKSRLDFKDTNCLGLDSTYRARDLINLLRGKTFFPESKNIFILDPSTGRKIYLSLHLTEEE